MRSLAAAAAVVAVAVALWAAPALAEPCLPASALEPAEGEQRIRLELGDVGGAPILCSRDSGGAAPDARTCWDLDPVKGKLTPRASVVAPGHGVHVTFANGCEAGYCAPLQLGDAEKTYQVYMAKSTDAAHVAMAFSGPEGGVLAIFDAGSKKLLTQIKLYDDAAPEGTSIGNMLDGLAYVDDTVYVVGSDAGPYSAVWAFKQDGTRLGIIKDGKATVSIYLGGLNILDEHHVGLSDPGLGKLVVLGGGRRAKLVRAVGAGPCKPDEIALLGTDQDGSKRCKRHIAAHWEPYVEASLVFAGGDLLAALGGAHTGELAILNGKTLAEQRRLWLTCK